MADAIRSRGGKNGRRGRGLRPQRTPISWRTLRASDPGARQEETTSGISPDPRRPHQGDGHMRRPVAILLGLLVVILAIVAGVYYNKYEKTTHDLATSQSAQEQSEGNYQKTMDAIAEIQDSLNAISLGDTSV